MNKERPIIMTAESVRAILAGTKTQTRRVVKPQPAVQPIEGMEHYSAHDPWPNAASCLTWDDIIADTEYYVSCGHCPLGKPGDLLWVRETFGCHADTWGIDQLAIAYRADGERDNWHWRSPIHMPRWASRITLEITGVRVQRVQEISDYDAIEEGVDRTNTSIPTYAIQRYRKLWDSINAKRGYSWDSNPYVWVVEFRRATA